MIPQHSSKTNEHYTPADVVECAREVMGGITLDPASCYEANRVIQAPVYFTQDEDGLALPWSGRVFLNPPGGRAPAGAKFRSSMALWWDRLAASWAHGAVEQAIFVGFTLEILRLSQATALPVQAFPRCYPRERMCFGGDDPTHANVIVYLPPAGDATAPRRFLAAFSSLGLCEGGGL